MADRTPARKSTGASYKGSLPPSPLGATPRPPLRQVYPKPPQGSYLSEYELNESAGSDYRQVTRTTKTNYTQLRSTGDDVDAPIVIDDSGSSTKPFFILGLIFLAALVALGLVYLGFPKLDQRIVQKYLPQRVAEWQQHVERHREHLLNYIVFLRITPFLPNWFINITSPVINVPLLPFFIGTVIGVAPPSFVAIQAGTTLHQLTSSGDAVSWKSMGLLAVFALLSLLPVVFKKRLREKFD